MARKVSNGRWPELTHQHRKGQRDRWTKMYRGKRYYFSIRPGEGTDDSYKRCLLLWQDKKRQIDGDNDHGRAWRALAENLTQRLNKIQQEDTEQNRKLWRLFDGLRKTYLLFASRGEPCGLLLEGKTVADIENDPNEFVFALTGPDDYPAPRPPWEAVGDDSTSTNQSPAVIRTVASEAAKFLADKRSEVEDGAISHGRLNELTVKVNQFASRFKESEGIEAITSDRIRDYYTWLREPLGPRKNSKKVPGQDTEGAEAKPPAFRSLRTVSDYKRDMKQFVAWLVAHDLIVKPSILDSRTSTKIAQKDIVVFSDNDLQVLFENAHEKLRLFMLLGLNCCATQVDIGTLKHNDVDWQLGRIKRKRHKTAKHENVPMVEYVLWPQTFELLKKHRSSHEILALTADDGGPLWDDSVGTNGIRRIDAIWKPFAKVVATKIDLNRKSFKNLRKTASTRMETKYPQFTQLLLGHAAKDQSGRAYTQYPQAQFDEAVRWLGEQFAGVISKKD